MSRYTLEQVKSFGFCSIGRGIVELVVDPSTLVDIRGVALGDYMQLYWNQEEDGWFSEDGFESEILGGTFVLPELPENVCISFCKGSYILDMIEEYPSWLIG